LDNVTHTLFGALVAETAVAALAATNRAENPRFRTLALAASILANNLPDFDFVYRQVTAGKLGYLLHHRGHTHTTPGALGLGILTILLVLGCVRLGKIALSRREWRALWGLSLGGPTLHIALDYGNNYGVHPFWPIDDRWYYGDAIFIIEPLLWTAALPALLLVARTIVARAVYACLFGGALVIGRMSGVLSIVQLVVLTNLLLVVTFGFSRLRPRARAAAGLGGWLLVTGFFVGESRRAEARARSATATLFPTTRVVDIVTTPRPANPFCWAVLVLGTERDRFVARRAIVWTAPWARTRPCTSLDESTSTAPFEPIGLAEDEVHFESAYGAPLAELRELAQAKCTVAEFLRYARAPFWTERDNRLLVGDLRFDRSAKVEFTEFVVPEPDTDCPRNVPPWTPPRIDLLQASPR
jgi:inner membrane protein